MALLNIRATPVSNDIPSPAEFSMGRKIATLLPSRMDTDYDCVKQPMQIKKHKQQLQYNKTASPYELPPLYPGQDVRVLDKASRTWKPATIVGKCNEPRSYVVQTSSGNEIRRNRGQLRELNKNGKTDASGQEDMQQSYERCNRHTSPQHPTVQPTVQPLVQPTVETTRNNEHQVEETSTPSHNNTPSGDRVVTRYGRVVNKPQRYTCGT